MSGAKLGQHFLTRPETARWVSDSLAISKTDVVLEIGPGKGILTRELLSVAGKVVAVEKDPTLVCALHDTFSQELGEGRLVLVEQDIRDFDPLNHPDLACGYFLVANIPYYITGYIIRTFLTAKHQPQAMAVLIQKEVAERIVAKDNKHSLLSLSVHVYGTPRLIKVVKAGAFSPPPKVDSAILTVKNISRTSFKNSDHESHFFTLIHAGFASKRKMLAKQIRDLAPEDAFTSCGIQKNARAEDLTLEHWLCLSGRSTERSQ